MEQKKTVTGFASALDAEDYRAALCLLDENCVYDSPDGRLTGPAEIMASYQTNGDNARDRFDSISYRHEVNPLPDGSFRVTFFDTLSRNNRSHEFHCNQRVFVQGDRITRLIHEEIPEQRQALNEFLESLASS